MLHGGRVGAGVQALVQLPARPHGGQEHGIIALLDGGAGEAGVGADVGDDGQARRGVEEEAAHDFGQDVFGQTGDAGIVKKNGAVDVVGAEQLVGEPAQGRFLRQAGGGLDEFDAAKDGSGLVLPAAAGGQHLFERKSAGEKVVAIPAQSAQITQGGEDGGGQNAAGAQARTLGRGGDKGKLDAAAKFAQLGGEGAESAAVVEAGQESGQGQGGLGEGKGISGLGEGFQFGVGADALFH